MIFESFWKTANIIVVNFCKHFTACFNRGPYSPGGGNGSAAAVAAVAAAVGGDWSGKQNKNVNYIFLNWFWRLDACS